MYHRTRLTDIDSPQNWRSQLSRIQLRDTVCAVHLHILKSKNHASAHPTAEQILFQFHPFFIGHSLFSVDTTQFEKTPDRFAVPTISRICASGDIFTQGGIIYLPLLQYFNWYVTLSPSVQCNAIIQGPLPDRPLRLDASHIPHPTQGALPHTSYL